MRALLATAAASVVLTLTAVGLTPTAAYATDYASWNDVQNARGNEAAQQQLVARLQSEIQQLTEAANQAAADAAAKGELFQQAESAYQQAAFDYEDKAGRAQKLQAQADLSKQRAAQAAAQLARTGTTDPTAQMLGNPDGAADLLSMLSFAKRMSIQQQAVYESAIKDSRAAQAATDQADVAKGVRERAKAESEAAFDAANAASAAAQDAVDAQVEHQAEAQAQLQVLAQKRQATEADYTKGVEARAAAERARLAALKAATAAAGSVNSSGWARPSGGGISSGYGWRVHPISGNEAFHEGVDLAGGCSAPIYAAQSGTVVYAGVYGGYGNYIRIDHGGGLSTAYGHIVNGGILVRNGQQVTAGQNIARIGSTGNSTGCHLHFEVRQNGVTTDPVAFMRGKGITLG